MTSDVSDAQRGRLDTSCVFRNRRRRTVVDQIACQDAPVERAFHDLQFLVKVQHGVTLPLEGFETVGEVVAEKWKRSEQESEGGGPASFHAQDAADLAMV